MNVRDKHFEEGVVPPGWKIQKFMDTMILQRGFDLPSKSRTAGPFPLIASNGNIDSHIDFKVKAPAIVTGRSGTIGKVYYEIKDCWPLNTTLYVKEMHGNDPRFLYYFLLNFDLNRFATGTGVPTLNRNVVHDQFVSIPTSIGEQRKIAEILSTVDEKIEVIESQITQTQELKRGLMQRLLTKGIGHTQFKHSPLGEIPDSWNVEKLGDHIVKVGSGITPRGGHESYVKNGVLFLRSQNVLRGKLNLTDVAYIPIEQHNKMSGSKVQIGDVLLNITGASIGRSCVVPSSVQEANVNQHVCIIRPTEDINSTFLS
ncbi:MAG: restriction endonuclease subunit S, partial [Pedobacter sp.]